MAGYMTVDGWTREPYVFHAGDKHAIKTLSLQGRNATSIAASDFELQLILEQFPNIPVPSPLPRKVTWFGDDAKFIAHHLVLDVQSVSAD